MIEYNLRYYATVLKDARHEPQDPEVLDEIASFLLRVNNAVLTDLLTYHPAASSNLLESIKAGNNPD